MRDPRVNGLYLLFELAALNYTGAYAAFSAGEGGGGCTLSLSGPQSLYSTEGAPFY